MNLLTYRRPTALALFLLGGAALVALPTAFAASIDTYPNFFSAEEVKHFNSVDVDKGGVWYTAKRGRDAAALDPAIARRLHDVTGTAMTAEEQRQYRRSIPVTKITGTTDAHLDRHHDSGEPVDGKVAFVFLNDNADATFIHGSTEIPAEAGKLVVFDGDVPHNTQIARGSLSLAGPVDLRRLTPVETPPGCRYDSDCDSDPSKPKCSCTADGATCSDRRLNSWPIRRLTTSDDGNTDQRQLQKLQFLRKLDEVHEREVAAEEERKTSDGYAADINFDASNRRRLSKSGKSKSGKSCPDYCGTCVPKSTKSPKGDTCVPANCFRASCNCEDGDKNAYCISTTSYPTAFCDSSGCCDKGYSRLRRMQDLGDRQLTLQYMTDRFKEEGSVRAFVDSLGNEVDLNSGTGEKDNALSKEDCESLMSLINEDLFSTVDEGSAQDIETYVDESDLVSVIGKDKFNTLLDLHKDVVGAAIPLTAIMIRNIQGSANNDAFIEYHTDESGNEHGAKVSTLIVALNDNSSVKEGGELYYLREDGPVLSPRAQGKAFAHSYNVLHGVAPHVGERVSLVLHFDHDLKMEDVGGRKLTEETKRKHETKRFIL